MTWTLLAYEDNYYKHLHTLVKAIRRDLGRTGTVLEAEPVGGTGKFENELGRQLGRREKRTGEMPGRVVCVADADRPGNLAGTNAPPRPAVPTPDALLEHAGHGAPALRDVFARCSPDPTSTADAEFLSRYQKPGACMDSVVQALEGRKYKKGRDDETILDTFINPRRDRRDQVLARCPDLRRLIERIG